MHFGIFGLFAVWAERRARNEEKNSDEANCSHARTPISFCFLFCSEREIHYKSARVYYYVFIDRFMFCKINANDYEEQQTVQKRWHESQKEPLNEQKNIFKAEIT